MLTFRENCEDKMDQFLKRCFYHSGQYGSEENFQELDEKLKEKEVKVAPFSVPMIVSTIWSTELNN